MNAQFKQSVVIDGHKFPIHQNGQPMVHNVPPKVAKHPHFKHFVKAGLISVTDQDAAPAKQESVEERNVRLAQKFNSQMPQVQKVESDPVEEPETEEDIDVDPDDEESVGDGTEEGDSEPGEDFGDESEDESPEVDPNDEPEQKSAKSKSKAKKKKKRKH